MTKPMSTSERFLAEQKREAELAAERLAWWHAEARQRPPAYAVRKALREATLAVGRTR